MNVIVEWLLCAYSRDNIVWQSYAHDLGQAAHGAGREAGRSCVFARTVIRTHISVWATYLTALLLLSYAISRYTPGGWERVAGRSVLEFHNDPPSRLRSCETLRVKRASM